MYALLLDATAKLKLCARVNENYITLWNGEGGWEDECSRAWPYFCILGTASLPDLLRTVDRALEGRRVEIKKGLGCAYHSVGFKLKSVGSS